MLRDAFGRPLEDCSECKSGAQRALVPDSMLHLLCTHPAAVRANGGVPWAAAVARDHVCHGRWFVRTKR